MEITLENVFAVLRKYLVLILVVALAAGIGAYLVSRYMIAPTYVSTVKMNLVVPPENLKSYSDGNTAWVYANRQVLTCVELLQSKNFRSIVRETSGLSHEPGLTISYNDNSTIISIQATDSSPVNAYHFAKAAQEKAGEFVSEMNVAMLTLVTVDEPEKSTAQIAPRPLRNVAIAAVAAAAIMFVIEFLRETLGTRIKDENELARHYEFPVIAVIPDFNDVARNGSYYYDYKQYGKKEADENGEK